MQRERCHYVPARGLESTSIPMQVAWNAWLRCYLPEVHYNAALMALTSGTKLGPYEIQSQVGAGGMGEVYLARDTRLDRTVAIKVLA